jgi:hypothetical protein
MDQSLEACPYSMSGSTMFDVAYGLRCDSIEDPMLIRMEKLVTAVAKASISNMFFAVRLLLAYAHDNISYLSNSLEHISRFEASSFLDAWRFIQGMG